MHKESNNNFDIKELTGNKAAIEALLDKLNTLNEDSQLLAETTNASRQGILVLGKETIEFFNPKAKEMLDVPDKLMAVGKPWQPFFEYQIARGDLGNKASAEKFMQKFHANFSKNLTQTVERKGANGLTLLVDRVANSLGGLTITFTNITDIKRREEELEKTTNKLKIALAENKLSKERFKSFAEANTDWFWEMDNELRFCYFSDGFESVSGVKPDQLLGKTRQEIGITDVDPKIYEAHLDDIKAHRAFRDFTHPQTKDDGSIVWLATSANPVFDIEGNFEGYLGSGRDITEVKKHEQELKDTMKVAESAERAKSEFLANMSHEIRTPMNGVMGMAELLASTELNAKQKMFTNVIVKSGASLLTIINDILDFSKIDAGQMKLDIAPFNLAEAIDDVATLVSSKVAEKDLELIVRVDPALPKMMEGDVGRIRQIVTNILGNAVKFTEKGQVFVNIEGKSGQADSGIANLKFTIEDTGIGIPEEKCVHVFQKFSQVDTSASRKHEGTGLGLSISSSLVELMGGKIGVESEVDKGTTFWFTVELPIHNQAEEKYVVPGDMTGARVLVIDDNKVNRSILTEQMAAWKFDGASACSGAEGLDVMYAVIANNMTIDLVILDYQMPEMNGEKVLSTMRNDKLLKDIPVIMLTSVDSSQTNQKLHKLGAEANLTKPTRSSVLLETALQVIANKRADIKSRSINNLNARPTSNLSTTTPQAAHPNEIVESRDQQLDILVAEDNEVNQIVFRQILEETGLNFKIVENGRLAYASYKVQQPRLILMDVSMPEMNGKEATMAIRKYEREAKINHTPIVGVTAHALKGDMEACIDAGMDDYLSKPVSPSNLSLKIEQWLKLNLGNSITG